MTLTINVPDEVAAQVRSAAKARGQDIESFGTGAVLDAVSVLADTNDSNDQDWWQSLSREDRAAEVEALVVSLADADAGRVRPASELFARMGGSSQMW